MTRFSHIVGVLLFSICIGPTLACAEDGFFYYEDANGVLHFTDQRPAVKHQKRFFSQGQENRARVQHHTNRKNWTKREIRKLIRRFSTIHELPPALIEAVVRTESSYNPYAVSKKGARGLMQLMPQTAKALGVREVHNPEENLNGGILYLSKLLKKYRGNLDLSLAAYNAGPTAVDRYNGVPPYQETTTYIEKVKNSYERLLRRDIRSVTHAIAERETKR